MKKNLHSIVEGEEGIPDECRKIALDPEAALFVFSQGNPEQIKKALAGVSIFFEINSFDPENENHVNALSAIIDFIKSDNEILKKSCFLALKSFVKTIRDVDIVDTLSSFLLEYIDSVIAPTTILAINVLTRWFSSFIVFNKVVNNDVLELIKRLLEKKDIVLEKAVLKMVAVFYQHKVIPDECEGGFLAYIVSFASQRFDEGTENILPFITVLYNATKKTSRTIRMIKDKEIYINLNAFIELEPNEETQRIIVLSLSLWQNLLISYNELLEYINFPLIINYMTCDILNISYAATVTASYMISANKESLPALFGVGLLENLEAVIHIGSSKAKQMVTKIIHDIINTGDIELIKAIVESSIFETIVSNLDSELNDPFINISLIIINNIFSVEASIGIDIKERLSDVDIEDTLVKLSSSPNENISSKASAIIDNYFTE